MHHVDQRKWFDDHELEECPRCRERSAITTPDVNAIVCIDCGFVGFRAAGNASGPSAA